MDDLIVLLIWLVIFAGAGIWKLLAKLLGSAEAIGKAVEAGKQSKGLLDVLLSGDPDKVAELLKEQAEAKPPAATVVEEAAPPLAKAEMTPRIERPAPMRPKPAAAPRRAAVETAPARPPQAAPVRRLRRVAETKAAAGRPRTWEEEEAPGDEEAFEGEGPARTLRPVAVPAAIAPAAAQPPVPAPVLQPVAANVRQWLKGGRQRLQEAFVISEILGPPKALARRVR
ncbi:MAG: hypothetical protein N3D11_00420 [Candidatus Sumerlaeia bacterium]|nr:hypothetical protein [Candidatus Sumerlaeia bacterium]